MAEIIVTVDVIRHDNTKCDKRQGRMFAPTLTADASKHSFSWQETAVCAYTNTTG